MTISPQASKPVTGGFFFFCVCHSHKSIRIEEEEEEKLVLFLVSVIYYCYITTRYFD